MIDIDKPEVMANQLSFYSDVSTSEVLGMGAVFNNHWLYSQWELMYIHRMSPSIEYLELYVLVTMVITWVKELKHIRMVLYCDNEAVVNMVNNMASKCPNYMYLLFLLAIDNLIHSRRVFAKHLRSEQNYLSDALSRLQFDHFWRLASPNMDKFPTKSSEQMWPSSKIWQCLKN